MRNIIEIPASPEVATDRSFSACPSVADQLTAELRTNGIVALPPLLTPEQLRAMQAAFEARLKYLRWNHFEGYQRTEVYRHMVEDVLLLDQGFVDLAIHPLIKQILNSYLGTAYELAEAKGWKSLPTKYDFHGWHGDSWYDQTQEQEIHKEVKLAMYLTDVSSGAFHFIKGSHRKEHPRVLKKAEVEQLPFDEMIKLTGAAGTAFLFDTSAIHRQGIPMLEPRLSWLSRSESGAAGKKT
jgi:ectoine hydroxylase-related dioxygenase (phytanoyl-CoA dioxygenase family)